MKRKIIASFMVFMILFTNYAFAALNFTRPTDGATVKSLLSEDHKFQSDSVIYLDENYDAVTNFVTYDNIKAYDYNTTNTISVRTSATTDKKKFYLHYIQRGDGKQLFYTMNLNDNEEFSNVATFEYKNAVKYNGTDYNLRLNIKAIRTQGCSNAVFGVKIANGSASIPESDSLKPEKYESGTLPHIRVEPGENGKVEVDVDYIVIDQSGNQVNVNGLYDITDIDLNQGVYIKDVKLTSENTYAHTNLKDSVRYKYINGNSTYVYSSTDEDLNNEETSVYILINDRSKIEKTFTWDGQSAASNIAFARPEQIKPYHKITTEVVNGTITKSVGGLIDNASKKIEYSPADGYKLKSVTVDGNTVDKSQYSSSYTFSNIRENHKIKVVYEQIKWKVTFDAKNQKPKPDDQADQTVVHQGKATKPTDPTYDGYEFKHWVKKGTNEVYDFNTPVTSNVDLEAVWTPIQYKINYVLNLDGAKNDSDNPGSYKKGDDDINFKNAISPNSDKYTFLGWYEDKNFTKKIDGISPATRTGDVTVYAKWKEEKEDEPTPDPDPEPDPEPVNAKYKVEHYKENEDGEYELVSTDTLTGKVDSTVTATPNNYTGYKENTTYKDRVPSGKVKSDNSLKLKLYYDKIKYTVTFDPKNDTDIPDQIVPYMDKAEEPTAPIKEGYIFKYWYYLNENGQKVKYNFDDPVIHDVDLIAEWEEVKEDEPEEPEYIVPKTDDYTAPKTEAETILPKTGSVAKSILLITIVIIAGIFFGIKYRNLKNIIK